MSKKVLFICKQRIDSYGVSYGLINSANFLANFLNKKGIDSKVATVVDSNTIDKEVYNYKATHVIIHALFVPTYKLEELIKKYNDINRQILIHSKISFLANEGIAIEWLKKYDNLAINYKNLGIAANNIQTVNALNLILNNKVLYLPNVYYHDIKLDNKPTKNENEFWVGCFGAVRPLKNHLIQAIAAMVYSDKEGKKLKFFINSSRIEQKGEPVYKNLKALFEGTKHELVEVPWLNHKDFLNIVNQMDLGMQLSFTETFNIVAADLVYCKVPLIASKEINWLPFYSKTDTQNINCIINSIKLNYLKIFNNLFTSLNSFNLYIKNSISKCIWLRFIRK